MTGSEFENVGFGYSDKPVLQHISFTSKKGKTLIGGTIRVGKSNHRRICCRDSRMSKRGAYASMGKDIRDYTMESLRSQMSFVTQDVILFNDTASLIISHSAGPTQR